MNSFKHYYNIWQNFLLPLVTISTILPRCHLIGLLLARTTMFNLSSAFDASGRAVTISLEEWPNTDDIITGATSAAVGGRTQRF